MGKIANKINKAFAAKPRTPKDVVDYLDLYDSYLVFDGAPHSRAVDYLLTGFGAHNWSRTYQRPDSWTLPKTVTIVRSMKGSHFLVPRQAAYFDPTYHSRSLEAYVLTLKGVELATNERKNCSLAVPDFRHEAIGSVLMNLMQGSVEHDQAQRLQDSGEIYRINPGDPLGMGNLSSEERRQFHRQLDAALNRLHDQNQQGPPDWLVTPEDPASTDLTQQLLRDNGMWKRADT